jgi:hypothetical protein
MGGKIALMSTTAATNTKTTEEITNLISTEEVIIICIVSVIILTSLISLCFLVPMMKNFIGFFIKFAICYMIITTLVALVSSEIGGLGKMGLLFKYGYNLTTDMLKEKLKSFVT